MTSDFMADPADSSIEARLDQVESHLAIQQLAARYALAVDSRDIDGLVELFVTDVNAGRLYGRGREALTAFFRDSLKGFYRSMHLISAHVIYLDGPATAHGVVYCRAEYESGRSWGNMVMNYKDDYERDEGRWRFRRRRLQLLYDAPEQSTGLRLEDARLPQEYPTFAAFFAQLDPDHVVRLTNAPVD